MSGCLGHSIEMDWRRQAQQCLLLPRQCKTKQARICLRHSVTTERHRHAPAFFVLQRQCKNTSSYGRRHSVQKAWHRNGLHYVTAKHFSKHMFGLSAQIHLDGVAWTCPTLCVPLMPRNQTSSDCLCHSMRMEWHRTCEAMLLRPCSSTKLELSTPLHLDEMA